MSPEVKNSFEKLYNEVSKRKNTTETAMIVRFIESAVQFELLVDEAERALLGCKQ
jgi:hypothetical protein